MRDSPILRRAAAGTDEAVDQAPVAGPGGRGEQLVELSLALGRVEALAGGRRQLGGLVDGGAGVGKDLSDDREGVGPDVADAKQRGVRGGLHFLGVDEAAAGERGVPAAGPAGGVPNPLLDGVQRGPSAGHRLQGPAGDLTGAVEAAQLLGHLGRADDMQDPARPDPRHAEE